MDWEKVHQLQRAKNLSSKLGFKTRNEVGEFFGVEVEGSHSNINSYIYYEGALLDKGKQVEYKGFLAIKDSIVVSDIEREVLVSEVMFTDYTKRPELNRTTLELIEPIKVQVEDIYYSLAEVKASCVDHLFNKSYTNGLKCEKQYPPELQLAVDAYNKWWANTDTAPDTELIQDWLKTESIKRQIDFSKAIKGTLPSEFSTVTASGLSNKSLKTILKIIKPISFYKKKPKPS